MKIYVFGLFILAGLFILMNGFYVVQAGQRGVVTYWGAVTDTIKEEGVVWVIPFAQRLERMDIQLRRRDTKTSAASKDLQAVSTSIALNYHLKPLAVRDVYRSVRQDYEARIIEPAVQEAVKAATALFTAEELITKRPAVKIEMKNYMQARLESQGIYVDDISITNFAFSENFEKSIEQKVTAEQEALTAKNKLEQTKFEAEQQLTKARAEAESIRIQAEAVTQQGGKDYVQLKAVEKWDGKLPNQMIPGATVPFLDLTK